MCLNYGVQLLFIATVLLSESAFSASEQVFEKVLEPHQHYLRLRQGVTLCVANSQGNTDMEIDVPLDRLPYFKKQ